MYAFVSIVLLALFSSGPALAAASKTSGNIDPFALSINAMQDSTGNTEVTLTVTPVLPSFAVPTSSKHVQLKSFDTQGELRWTKNTFDVPLAVSGGTSSTVQNFTDMQAHQPVNAQIQIQNKQTVNTKVLKAVTTVKLRPDVSLADVQAPAQANVGELVNIAVTVSEENGDLGATTDLVLSDGLEVLDTVSGISLSAGGSVGAVFAVPFDDLGFHDLTITAGNVVPGDFDTANNTVAFTIEIINPSTSGESVPFELYYNSQDYHHYNTWADWYGYGTSEQSGFSDQFYETMWLPQGSFSYPIDELAFSFSADGGPAQSYEITGVSPYYDYNDGCYEYGYSGTMVAPGTWFYTGKYASCYYGYSYSYAQFYKYTYSYTYYSTGYDYWYGSYYYSSSWSEGDNRLNATQSIATNFMLSDNGQSFGGQASLTLQPYENYYPWDYYWGGGYSSGFNWYAGYSGWTSGLTQ